jgi:uncharacterized protein YecA (UPF0149 family)
MFGRLMDAIDDDYLKYVMHVEAVVQTAEVDLNQASYDAADDPVSGTAVLAAQLLADSGVDVAAIQAAENRAAVAAQNRAMQAGRPGVSAGARPLNPTAQPARPAPAGTAAGPAAAREAPNRTAAPAVAKTPGRNDPCYCGSGKKYKLCHGAA